jgi:hypothetical protein
MKVINSHNDENVEISDLWVKLENEIYSIESGDNIWERIATKPWLHKNVNVRMAWDKITNINQFDYLDRQIDDLNKYNRIAKEYRIDAWITCYKRIGLFRRLRLIFKLLYVINQNGKIRRNSIAQQGDRPEPVSGHNQ